MATVMIAERKFGWVSSALAKRRNHTDEPGLIEGWSATVDGAAQQLVLTTTIGVVLVLDREDRTIPWDDIISFSRGILEHSGGRIAIRLTDTDDTADFIETLQDRDAAVPLDARGRSAAVEPPMIPAERISTLMTHPAVPNPQPIGMVFGQAVVSRNWISDLGSDLSSLSGGRLGGIEKAVDSGLAIALAGLRINAAAVGAHAVVGVDVSVQTVSDKAQLVLMSGTAVVAASAPA